MTALGQNKGGFDIKTSWKKPGDLVAFLRNAQLLKVFFCKNRHDEERCGFGIIVRDSAGDFWVSHFLSKKLRDSLITTTVISALRSHKDELRLVHYTWFGKLVKGLWEKNKNNIDPDSAQSYNDLIRDKSVDIKALVDRVFAKETEEIRKLLEGAIAYRKVSFKFMNDTNEELYKNVQLFIHDGIDRPLSEKGTGIQSAIIISLFSLYCDTYHNSSSLLIAEEPELFLHPQARRVISAELNKFLSNCQEQPRQLIISTHSTEYLKNVDPNNIIRVSKNAEHNCSEAHQLKSEVAKEITAEIKRFLWSNNTEIFFADKAVLVEGGELYLIPAITDLVAKKKQHLDYENVTVARVDGKGNFLTYVKMLQCFDIEFVVLGDLDCFKDAVPKLAAHLHIDGVSESLGKIKAAFSLMPVDYKGIYERAKGVDKNLDAQDVQRLFEKVSSGTIAADDDDDLLSMVAYMRGRYTKGDRYAAIINAIGEAEYARVHQSLRNNRIFIWAKGDLESCYTDEAKSIKGSKDIVALTVAYKLQAEGVGLGDFFQNTDEIRELVQLILIKDEKMTLLSEGDAG